MNKKPPPLSDGQQQAGPSVVIPEVLPPESQPYAKAPDGSPPLPRWLNKKKLVLAFIIAALSDALSVWFQLMLPVQLGLDLLTAFLLFIVLGWRWPLLLGLLLEAIPGVAIFPAWVLVVGAIAALGEPRPRLR